MLGGSGGKPLSPRLNSHHKPTLTKSYLFPADIPETSLSSDWLAAGGC